MLKNVLVFLGILLSAGMAQATVFDCKIKVGSSQNFISDRYLIEHLPAAGTVRVFDGLIKEMVGKPVDGKLSQDTAAQSSFTWSVLFTDRSGNHARLNYRATYFKANSTMTVFTSVGGGEFVGNWNASGSCTLK